MVDHYDVLGIRPSAERIEIDMAYKGRRTQYHPDRYGQSDPETIAWATRKLQEVNEAFAVLSDPTRRQAFDRQRRNNPGARQAPPPEPPRQPKAPPERPAPKAQARPAPDGSEPELVDYLRGLKLPTNDIKRFHVHPHIPPNIRHNVYSAREWRAGRHATNELQVVLDDTLGGGCKEGIAVTEGLISFKSLFEEAKDYGYTMGFRGGLQAHGMAIYSEADLYKKFVHVSELTLRLFCDAFNHYLKDHAAWHLGQANAGVSKSQVHMSFLHYDDDAEAMRWMTLAAEAGDQAGQHNLGCMLEGKDNEAAFYWLTKAADQGSEYSASRLKDKRYDRFRNGHR